MKLRYWSIGIMAIFYYIVSCQSDPYEEREEIVECKLPSGGRFTLKAAYQAQKNTWGNLLGGHAAQRINQENFKIYYQPPGQAPALIPKATASRRTFEDDPTGRALCANFGEKNGAPYASGLPTYYLPKQARDFLIVSSEEKLTPFGFPSEASDEEERQLRQRLKDEHLTYGIPVATQLKERTIWETALMKDDGVCKNSSDWRSACPISSVFKYVSLDSGRTWQAPQVTTQSEIFELGRSLYEQSFIARPVRINGKEVVPRASPSPQPESKTAFPPAL